MNLHLLPADSQLFVPKFVEMVTSGAYAQSNLLMCYVREMSVADRILPLATAERVRTLIKHDSVNRVIFHALQPQAYSLIEIIKEFAPNCRIDWVYWGETYDDPSRVMGFRTLSEYLMERGFPDWLSFLLMKTRIVQMLLRVRNALSIQRIARCAQQINTMFHWSPADYDHVKMLLHCRRMEFQQFVYDVIDFETLENTLMERDLECNPADCIVLGHSATMRNNHLDVLPEICKFAISRNKILVCPLSYGTGGAGYVDKIRKYLSKMPGLIYRVSTKFYPQIDYLNFLSKCGLYIAPGRGSLGAGNMFVYALSGGVPVTDPHNSTGLFLKSLGLEVAMYRTNKDIINQLDKAFGSRNQKNQLILADFFSLKNRMRYYEHLLDLV